MKHEAFSRADWHPLDCDGCPTCEPYVPSVPRVRHAADRIALLCLAGIAVGLVLAWILDRAVGGPGLAPMFGL